MKNFLSKMIVIVCVLTIGFIGLFSLANRTEAHPKRLDKRLTTYYCYVMWEGGGGELCTSYTDYGERAVWPWDGHRDEKGPHKPHTEEPSKWSYDNERYERESCSKC